MYLRINIARCLRIYNHYIYIYISYKELVKLTAKYKQHYTSKYLLEDPSAVAIEGPISIAAVPFAAIAVIPAVILKEGCIR